MDRPVAGRATPPGARLVLAKTPHDEGSQQPGTVSARGQETEMVLHAGESSWTEVLDSMQVARQEYDDKAGKSKFRDVHANKSILKTLEALTEMIPDQDGLSVLKGGLKAVFSVSWLSF
jgi:hypothetical protein